MRGVKSDFVAHSVYRRYSDSYSCATSGTTSGEGNIWYGPTNELKIPQQIFQAVPEVDQAKVSHD